MGQRLRGQREGRRDNSSEPWLGCGESRPVAEGSRGVRDSLFHGALNLRPTGSASSFRTSLSTE